MELVQVIGIGASIGTGVSLLPQLVKLVKEEKAEDLSLGMMAVLLTGLALWIVYGILKKDAVIIVSNGVSLIFNISIIFLSLYYRSRPGP